MRILAIDPGTEQTGFARFEDGFLVEHGVMENYAFRDFIRNQSRYHGADLLAVEMIASYGMAVGKEVFETCVWIGRFVEAWGWEHRMVYRKDVKLHLCGTPRAKDANIRQALIDKLGPQGNKRNPGPTYGVRSHAWAALAVAVTAAET